MTIDPRYETLFRITTCSKKHGAREAIQRIKPIMLFVMGMALAACGRFGFDAPVEPEPECQSDADCEDEDICLEVICSGHGQCVAQNGEAQCICDTGFHNDGPTECVADVSPEPNNMIKPGCLVITLSKIHFAGFPKVR